MTLHLRKKDKDEILKIATQTLNDEVSIWAYGSRVNGSSHDGSDLDLVLRRPAFNKIDLTELENFQQSLLESNIPIIIQAFDWARIPESFHKNILNSYIPLR